MPTSDHEEDRRATRRSTRRSEKEKEKDDDGGRKRRRSRSRSRSRERSRRSRSRSGSRETRSSRRSSRRRSPSRSRSRSRDRRRGAADNGKGGGAAAEETSSSSSSRDRKKSRTGAAAEAPAPLPPQDAAAIARAKALELAARIKAETAAAAAVAAASGSAPPAPVPTPVPPPPAVAAVPAALQPDALQEQIRRQVEQMKARLQQQQQQAQQQAPAAPGAAAAAAAAAEAEEKKPLFRPMRFDDQGREIDEEGNVIKVDLSAIRSVKANIAGPGRRTKEPATKAEAAATGATAAAAAAGTDGGAGAKPRLPAGAKGAGQGGAGEEDEEGSLSFMDPRLKVKDRSRRSHRGLAFVDPGTYVRMAERQRAKEHGAMMGGFASGRNPRAYSHAGILDVADDAAAAAAGDKSAAAALPMVSLQALPLPPEDATAPVPAVEWWDEPFLPKENRAELAKDPASYGQASLAQAKTHTYVQHPVPLRGIFAGKEDPEKAALVMPTYLTKKERKRLRRQARKEREQEKRDKIALGLMPAPEPKLNLTNFMKVLANESIADPSAVTAKIQQQIKERQRNHDMRNMARKLTPEERREKKRRKIINDMKKQIEVALFRVRSLSSPKIRYKIDVNAQQSGLSGAVLTCRDPAFGDEGIHLVVVEGGPRAIRRYIKLMLRRIKWDQREGDADDADGMDEDSDEDDEEEAGAASGAGKRCELVWKGVVAKPAFTGFKFQECKTITTARKVMESRGVVHYFDMVVNAGADGLGVMG